jgi:hypothetical protein
MFPIALAITWTKQIIYLPLVEKFQIGKTARFNSENDDDCRLGSDLLPVVTALENGRRFKGFVV